MEKKLLDVEVFPNFFCVGIKEYNTNERLYFEISEWRDDRMELIRWLTNYRGFLITFNGLHYDIPVLLYILRNQTCTNKDIMWFSSMIIEDERWYQSELKKYRYHDYWKDIDVFLFWPMLTRKSKRISLKGLAIALNYPVIQELPYDPHHTLASNEERENIINYNTIHDLGILERIVTYLEDKIKLRIDIYNTLKLPCLSWDTIKIASESLVQALSKTSGISKYDITKWRFSDDTKPDFSNFQVEFKDKKIREIYNKAATKGIMNDNFMLESLPLSVGEGGIHSINRFEEYFATDKYAIITSDVASLYPTIIENWNLIRFKEVMKEYSSIKVFRIAAKREGRKLQNEFYKLVLNGVSGLLDQEYSWLRHSPNALKMRMIGQFIIMKLCENVFDAEFKVVSANTDGIEVIVERSRLSEYYEVIETCESQFNIEFEHEFYKSIHYQAVNDYIAFYEGTEKTKKKGSFVTHPEIQDSFNTLVIPKALEAFFKNGTPVSDFIYEHDNLFDFCASQKVGKNYTILHEGKKQQRLNRYYASTNSGYLYKVDGGSKTHMLKSSGVTIANDLSAYLEHKEMPKDINYDYYIRQATDIISHFRKQQLKLF